MLGSKGLIEGSIDFNNFIHPSIILIFLVANLNGITIVAIVKIRNVNIGKLSI